MSWHFVDAHVCVCVCVCVCVTGPCVRAGGERGSGKKGEVYTATTLSRLISGLPKAKSGPTEIVIWDIHHLQERFYFEDSVIARLENSMEILVNRS
jgi:hypothetical protein